MLAEYVERPGSIGDAAGAAGDDAIGSGEVGGGEADGTLQSGSTRRPLDTARLGDHLDRLYRAAWALSGSREDADDLVQETYARVLARPRLLRTGDDLGYLLRTLRNTFLNQKRTENRRLRPGSLPDELDLLADPHAREPQAALEAAELYAAIAALPDDFRDVLVAVDITGLSYKDAARALRTREGTVMSRLYRARQQVVRRIEGRDTGSPVSLGREKRGR